MGRSVEEGGCKVIDVVVVVGGRGWVWLGWCVCGVGSAVCLAGSDRSVGVSGVHCSVREF